MLRERNHDRVCLLIRFSAAFRIRYRSASTGRSLLAHLIVPSDASLTSESSYGHSCVPDEHGYQSFDLSFGQESKGLHNLVLRLRQQEQTYQLTGIELEYVVNPDEFPDHWKPNGTLMTSVYSSDRFFVPRRMSYSCKGTMELGMRGADNVTSIMKDLQFEAFTHQAKPVFSEAVDCSLADPFYSDYVALIVFMGISMIAVSCLFWTLVQRFGRPSLLTPDDSMAALSPSLDSKVRY